MIHLPAHAYLIREGDQPTCGYLIERGSVEVLLERLHGDRILAILGPGEIVGEMALVDQAPRTASIRAREDCHLLPITADSLAKRLAAADPVLRLVLGTIIERFRTTLSGVGGLKASNQPGNKKSLIANAAATAELRLEKELEVALREGQIIVHYQPIVRLFDGRLTGFEALARWAHPTLGLVSPATFIPIAEASGLSATLASIALRQVVQALSGLRERATRCCDRVDNLQIAVNICGYDLMNPDFVSGLGAIAADDCRGAEGITLELTETALVESPGEASEALEEARRLGFKIAVDDFGTGYSSLNYIRTLPVDILKIDKSFVQGTTDSATTRSIVASMVHLGKSLGMTVVGEGIETSAQRTLLQTLGCDSGQGHLFGRPLPLDQTLDLISAWRPASEDTPSICAPSE